MAEITGKKHRLKKKTVIRLVLGVTFVVCILFMLVTCKKEAVPDLSEAFRLYLKSPSGYDTGGGFKVPLSLVEKNGVKAETVSDYPYGEENAIPLSSGDEISFRAGDIPAGDYFILFRYRILSSGRGEQAVLIFLNGVSLTGEESLPLEKRWKNEHEEFERDSFGNDSLPMQEFAEGYYETVIKTTPVSGARGLTVPVKNKDDIIKTEIPAGNIYLAEIRLLPAAYHVSYGEYDAANKKEAGEHCGEIVLEAEKPGYKTDVSVLPEDGGDINTTPYDTYKKRLSSVVSDTAGERLFYEFDVKWPGRYNISLNYSNKKAGSAAFRTIYLDGRVPFGELMHYPFPYSGDYRFETLKNGEDFSFYLSSGRHTLEIETDGIPASLICDPLTKTAAKLNLLYLDIRRLAGPSPDKHHEWEVKDYFPDIEEELEECKRTVERQKELLYSLNGNIRGNQASVFLDQAVRGLKKLLKKPDEIPNNNALISEDTGSVVQSVSAAVLEIKRQTLSVDRIFITPEGGKTEYKRKSGLKRFSEGLKFFFHSFTGKYRAEKDGDTIEIWANRPLQNVGLIQRMADSDFTKKTGIKVRVSMLKDEGKLVLANASGINPDGVIGISNWIPYELGLRDLVFGLNEMPDLGEVMRRFEPGAMLPLVADGKVLGIPETQDATVLFYRKDILENLHLSVPDTWEDVKKMLPVLQRGGMNFYLPVSSPAAMKPISSTAPFIYQCGGTLYGKDGMSAATDSESAVAGFRLLTDLYTIYGLPQQVANFAESFRDGSVPLGLGSVSLYSQLKVTAPELAGLWDIALSPGVKDCNGNISRWQGGGATCCVIMKKSERHEKTWKFLKWWMSVKVQAAYAAQCRAVWGGRFVWTSANTEAFRDSPFDERQKDIILKQWKWVLEVPRIPGWYMIERELSNAWSYVVIDGMNVRAAIDNVTTLSDREIRRKLTEFGYLKNGEIIRRYMMTDREDIENWQK